MVNKTPKKVYTKKNNFVILSVTPITPMNPQNIIELKCLLRVPITLHTPNILLKRILPKSEYVLAYDDGKLFGSVLSL